MDRIFGSNKMAKIKNETKLSFPDTKDEKRIEIEKVIKDDGKWDEVSSLDVRKLAKKFQEGGWEEDLLENVKEFAEKDEKKSVTLVKKNGKEE